MQDLFTYTSLSTLTGAVTATLLLVQFLKELGPFKRLPSRWLALILAEGILFTSNAATGDLAVKNMPLCFINGLLVAASAMGSWHVIHNLSGTANKRGKKLVVFSGKIKSGMEKI